MVKDKGRLKRYILGWFVLGLVLGYVIPELFYGLFPSGDRGAKFVKSCYDLNSKAFTYQNLNKLGGAIGLSEDYSNPKSTNYGTSHGTFGYYPFEERYFNDFIKGQYIINGNNYKKIFDKKMIGVNEKNGYLWFQIAKSRGTDGHWVCYVAAEENFLRTYSYAEFVPAD